MNNSFFFRREIDLISDRYFKDFVTWFLDNKVGKWFWTSGASSSGKFHPSFAQGEGGLVRHTRAVVLVCCELLRMSSYSYMNEEYKDFAIAACLLHDTCKYGTDNEENSDCYHEHGKLAALAVRQAWWEKYHDEAPELFCLAIRSHMGQWVEDKTDRPFTPLDRLVHLSDYIASRSFWDIPQLTNEYLEDKNALSL